MIQVTECTAALDIREADLGNDQVIELLQTHARTARAQTAVGSAHALDIDALKASDLTVWTAWSGSRVVGVGALKSMSPDEGEVKSMHTAQSARRMGVGRAMLDHIIANAMKSGLKRLYLETGSWDYFVPARAMYASRGFVDCQPFGSYRPDPNSVFMILVL